MDLDKSTGQYLQTVVADWSYIGTTDVEDDQRIPLGTVYAMPSVLESPAPAIAQKRDEIPDSSSSREILIQDGSHLYKHNLLPLPLVQAVKNNLHLVLLGEPGAGKSTTLQYLGLQFADLQEQGEGKSLGLDEVRIPILLRLSDFALRLNSADLLLKDELIRAVQEKVQERSLAERLFERWAYASRLLVLLDGLDETNQQRNQVISKIQNFSRSEIGKNARIILTSRLAGYTTLSEPQPTQMSSFREYTLRPLQGGDVEGFILGWLHVLQPKWTEAAYKAGATHILAEMMRYPALWRLRSNPLLLRLIVERYGRSERKIQSRAELYDTFWNESWERAKRRGAQDNNRQPTLEGIKALAWHLHTRGVCDEKTAIHVLLQSVPEQIRTEMEARLCLDIARLQMGIIGFVQGRIFFSHLTFQEYFASLRLREIFEKEENRSRQRGWNFIRPRLHLPEWREIILDIGSGLSEIHARALIKRVWHAGNAHEKMLIRDGKLAVDLLLERNDCQDVRDEFLMQARRDFSSHAFLGKLPAILKFFFQDKFVRSLFRLPVLLELASLDAARYESLLLDALSSRYYQEDVLELLSRNSDHLTPGLHDALCELLLQGSPYNSHFKYFGSGLLDRLMENRSNLPFELHRKYGDHEMSLYTLGCSSRSEAIPILINALYHSDQEIYNHVFNALIASPQRDLILNELMKMYDTSIDAEKQAKTKIDVSFRDHQLLRMHIVELVARMAGKNASPFLLKAIHDQSSSVRETAYKQVTNLLEPQNGIPELIEAALASHDAYRLYILEYYGRERAYSVVPVLLDILNQKTYRGLTIQIFHVLGELGDPIAAPVIRKRLGEIEQVFSSAYWQGKPLQAVQQEPLFSYDFETYHFAATCALSKLGDEAAVDNLIGYVRHKHFAKPACHLLAALSVSRAADVILAQLEAGGGGYKTVEACIEALGILRVQKAFPTLVKMADQYPTEVVQVLGGLGDVNAIPVISKYIQDNQYEPSMSAVQALAALGDQAAVPALSKCLSFQDRHIREAAITALGDLAGPETIPGLLECLEHWDSRTVDVADSALGHIHQRHPEEVESALLERLEKLIEQTRTYPYREIVTTVQVIEEIGSMRSMRQLSNYLDTPELTFVFAQAISTIASRMPDGDGKTGNANLPEDYLRIVRKLKHSLRRSISERSMDPYYSKTKFTEILTTVERVECNLSVEKDPFIPLGPQPIQRRVTIWVGYGGLAALLTGLLALLSVILVKTQDILKDKIAFLDAQPIPILALLVIGLSLVAGLIGWSIEAIRKRFIKE